jgi:glycosyltransferase involved in cell wall biosynthesis
MIKFSLIVVTLSRDLDLYRLLNSLNSSINLSAEDIEIIVVDQNPVGFLVNLEEYCPRFNIKHLHSTVKGISYNRNIGISVSKGEILAFPDDDCIYNPNTLSIALNKFLNSNCDFIGGRVIGLNTKKGIFRKWPPFELSYNFINFYFLTTSVSIFIRRSSVVNFDLNLGSPSNYGSCEDIDFIFRVLTKKSSGLYSPEILVYHPEPDGLSISREKVFAYAAGLGFFISKNLNPSIFLLFLIIFLNKSFQYSKYFLFGKSYYNGYFEDYYNGFIFGFFRKLKD